MDTSKEYIEEYIKMCHKAPEIQKLWKHVKNSMEQLWLAFVMYKKYGKKWDGKEWHFFTKTQAFNDC